MLAKGTAAPWPRPLPAMGFLGNACPVPRSRGHPRSFPAVGAGVGAGLTSPFPALGRGNTELEEITGNREAQGCGRINPS